MMSNRLYLQQLCNKHGDFKVAYSKKRDEKMYWSKHRSVLECWESERGLRFLDKANNRQILPTEIVLDIDRPITQEELNKICDTLRKANEQFYCYFTGSKGYHIHIWNQKYALHEQRVRKKAKQKIIEKFGSELLKSSENVMIAIAGQPHWKTGKKKRLIDSWEK